MLFRRFFISMSVLTSLAVFNAYGAEEDDTIKVGILHSLTGTMAISEITLKDTVLMLIEEQNKKGGLLGKQLEAVVVDPESNGLLFAEKARELIEDEKVDVVFGCWTSSSRKSVLPIFEKLNNILFYPVQYEGEESSRNIFYTGATPNQQAIPAVDYLKNELGVKRWILIGTDYVYPRTTNKILEEYLIDQDVTKGNIMISYTPFRYSDWRSTVSVINLLAKGRKKTGIISTINGDANIPFYTELANQGIFAKDMPVIAFSVGEEELSNVDTTNLKGHLAAWNYFQSVDNEANKKFINNWHEYTKDESRTVNDPMEATYIGFNMWIQAVKKAQTTDVDTVIDNLVGINVPNLSGGTSTMLPNHHITKPVLIGEIREDGQFDIISASDDLKEGDAWSDYLDSSRDIIGDWRKPINCGSFNTVTKECIE